MMMRVICAALGLLLALESASAETRLVGDLPLSAGSELEDVDGLDSEYGHIITSEGLRLRSFITRPQDMTGPLPAIFFTQAVSCGSIAFRKDRETRLKLLAQQSGLAMIRIERSGTGDSEGPGCDKLDYDTEVRHYREALAQMRQHPWVDPDRIVVLGSSLGSTTAPLVARDNSVAGVIVQGAGAVTYLERMIGFERLYVERSGNVEPENIHDEMVRRIAFLNHYLTEKMTPQQIADAHPELANIWENIRGTQETTHYGRPLTWHQQAADRNFLAAWLSLDAPVMVVFGEYEQFEMRHGHRIIVDMINRNNPGQAEWLELANADHGLRFFPDAWAAYANENPASAPQLYVTPVSQWLRRVTGMER